MSRKVRKQRRYARELHAEYMDDHPEATEEEAMKYVQAEMEAEGVGVDPATLFRWIQAFRAFWETFFKK